MFLGSFWNKISLLGWFFRICHTGKYFFITTPLRATSEQSRHSSFKKIPPEELFMKLSILLHGLDSQSIDTCMKYFTYYYHILDINAKVLNINSLIFNLDQNKFEMNLKYMRKKYPAAQFDDSVYEEIYSHHGLQDLPENAQEYIRNKIFIDAGAYDGNSSLVLLEYKPKKIYAFEISAKNAEKFHQNMESNKIPKPKVELCLAGLGDSEEEISFDDNGESGTTLEHSGKSSVHIVPADHFFRTTGPIGFIKADVEGFGYKMLLGMTEILKRDRPVLSLSIYHNAEEFLKMKPYLESLNLNYNIKIIPMANIYFGEICLFAVPKELL